MKISTRVEVFVTEAFERRGIALSITRFDSPGQRRSVELGEALKWQPLQGELLRMASDERGGRALIKLDDALNYRGSTWHYVVATPSYQGNEMTELQTCKKVLAALTGIPDQQAESSGVLDSSNWRGGLAFLGDVEPVTK